MLTGIRSLAYRALTEALDLIARPLFAAIHHKPRR